METRASYLLVGAFVLALAAGLAGFALWLARGDIERDIERYQIVFRGSVSGLQQGSQVRYRGIPVGRVTDIRIDAQDLEHILVDVDIRAGTPIKADTVAEMEMQGITGLVHVQLSGGTRDSPALEPQPGEPRPRIPSKPSPLEQVVEFTPELLARAVSLVERALDLLSEENIQALGSTARNLEVFSTTLAERHETFDALIGDTAETIATMRDVGGDLALLIADVRGLTASLDAAVTGAGGEVEATLAEIGRAGEVLAGAGQRLDALLAETREPWSDFTDGGLYEFTQLMGETRLLVAALSRITKEFERDPAGFLIGAQRGFRPE